MSNILMVGDDGNVYHIKSSDLAKVAKKVPKEKLSKDVQAQISKAAPTGKGKGVAHIFASKADIFVASKADIFVAGKTDVLSAAKADIFVAGKK